MLFVNSRFLTQDITGVQRFAIEISKQLKDLYGDNIVFVSPKNIKHHELAKELNVQCIGTQSGHFWEQIELLWYLKQRGNPILLNLGNTAPLFYNKNVVTVYDLAFKHHPEWFSKKFSIYYNFLVPKILKKSLHVFTDSNYVKDDIASSYGIKKDKITTIYGSYANIFTDKNTIKEKYILAVGSIEPRKNLESLIEVFKSLEYELIIVGQKHKVFSALKVSDLPENIKFSGYVSDEELVNLYNRAKIFIYPSFFEGFGIPPLEAQACGTPVITSDKTSLPEVGLDSFLYCNPYDKVDIENKLISLIQDEKLQKKLIEKGFENIKRFSWKESAKIIVKRIEELL